MAVVPRGVGRMAPRLVGSGATTNSAQLCGRCVNHAEVSHPPVSDGEALPLGAATPPRRGRYARPAGYSAASAIGLFGWVVQLP